RLTKILWWRRGARDGGAGRESPWGPAMVCGGSFAPRALPADAQIVQQVVDLGPAWHAERALAGFIANIVLAGEVAYKIGPELKGYKPREGWSAPAWPTVCQAAQHAAGAPRLARQLSPR